LFDLDRTLASRRATLAVVHPHRLAGFENTDVDPKLPEPLLAFEGAVGAERPFILPTRLAGIHDEPALAVNNEAVLGRPEKEPRESPLRV